jgi:hypothetical protein
MSVENPGGKRAWRGGYVCECQTLIIPIMEQRMIEKGCLKSQFDFYQYCYNSSVSASAGTHDQGGASDQAQDDWDCLTIMRECGGAAWARTPAQGFDPHCHMILCGCPHVSGGAADQVVDYQQGRNGLASGAPDDGPNVPYITWQDAYAKYHTEEPEGPLGMSKAFSSRRSADWTIPRQTDGWDKALPINDDGDSTVIGDHEAGDGMISATASITVSGLKDGEAFDLAWAIVDCRASDGGDAKWPTGWSARRDPRRAVGGSSGYRTVESTFTGTLGKPGSGRSKRLRLVYQTASNTAKLGSLTVEGGY